LRKLKKSDDDMNHRVVERVAEIYNWLDSQSRRHRPITGTCDVCGKCCDFGKYDHRLFVTTPEIMYLAASIGEENIKPMANGRCPYNTQGRCEIYKHRFASCRIFSCKGSKDIQSRISESILMELKSICKDMEIPYRYTDLPTALNSVKD
jgi:Fe-S-cluster containining protein